VNGASLQKDKDGVDLKEEMNYLYQKGEIWGLLELWPGAQTGWVQYR
jgi:hypothetical protein